MSMEGGALVRAREKEAALIARIAELEENVARLQRIIDSRPAINAGLPQTYIEWSQSIYTLDVVHAGGVPKH